MDRGVTEFAIHSCMTALVLRDDVIRPHLAAAAYPLVFVTVSGAHLYGFPSADSDYDLRGMHATPLRELVRLRPPPETLETMDKSGPVEVDLVTHDVRKYFSLMLRRNGYVLEQVCSPLVVHATPELDELRALVPACLTRHHRHHYHGFAENQWAMVVKNGRPTVKGLLYTYRVLLAGIQLMRTGKLEANINVLNQEHALAYIPDLIERKVSGTEKQSLRPGELERHEAEFVRLRDLLDSASAASSLPEETSAAPALDDLLVRIRMKHLE